MRIATLILSLVLSFGLFIQSAAISAGGELTNDDDLSGAGGAGMVAALAMLIGAAFVVAKPTVALWSYGVAAVFCLIGAGSGFSDLWIWLGVSVVFAAMAYKSRTEQISVPSQ